MDKYFYIKDNKRFGPFSLEQLKNENIFRDTLVWKDDLADWVKAEKLNELKITGPPPIPDPLLEKQSKNKIIINLKTAEKYSGPILFFGVMTLCIYLLTSLIYLNTFSNFDKPYHLITLYGLSGGHFYIYPEVSSLADCFFRLIIVYWIYKIACRKNRNPIIWIIVTFFFPPIGILIISLFRKKQYITLDKTLDIEYKLTYLFYTAKGFLNDKRYEECLIIIDEALKMNPNKTHFDKLSTLKFTTIEEIKKEIY